VPKPYVYNLFFEIYRLLKNGGYAVIQLLGFKMLPKQAQRISWQEEVRKQIYRIEGHWHHFYSAEELVMVLPASGFKHVDIRDGESIWFLVRPNAIPLPADFSLDRYLRSTRTSLQQALILLPIGRNTGIERGADRNKELKRKAGGSLLWVFWNRAACVGACPEPYVERHLGPSFYAEGLSTLANSV
jgi:hypothetical protein